MKKYRLGDLAVMITKGTTPTSLGFDFVDEGINFVKIESIAENGDFLTDKFAHISAECDNKLSRSQLRKNDILFSIAGAIGRTAIVTEEILPANTNQALAIIRVPEGVIDYSYLKYVLQSASVVEQFEKKKQGVAQLNISLRDISDFFIPLCSVEQQNLIVATIDKVSELIALRKQQLAKLDELVKSRFIEMFGEVETNIQRFTMKRMDECCKFIGGAQPDKSYFEYEKTDENVRLIQIRDYKSDKFITYIPKEMARKTCTAEDIMVGRYGPPIFQILGGIEGAYNVALMKAVPSKEFNVEYFRNFLKSEKLLRYLESFSQRTAGQDGIQIDKLNAYPCFVPPIELQNQFATFVEQVDKSKLAIQKSLEQLETLKKALMQKYFSIYA